MFDKEFFPTTSVVINQMLFGVTIKDKIFFEPSAGKGDIVNYLLGNGAKDVLMCEINNDLRKILSGKGKLLSNDCFNVTSEMISHINGIIMNPPFSCADKHILHMYNIAPEGCEIIALCNTNTLTNTYSKTRNELSNIIKKYGIVQDLGNCFSDAERTTDADVSIIKIYKPILSSNFNFDEYFFSHEEEVNNLEEGIVKFDEIRSIVSTYVQTVRLYDKYENITNDIKNSLKTLGIHNPFSCKISYGEEITSKNDFLIEVQRKCWGLIFLKLDVKKFMTKGVIDKLNIFINNQNKVPFTVENVYKAIELLFMSRESIMNDALVEAIDSLTKYTHENRYGVEGWKTNAGHLLNQKFIASYIVELGYNGNVSIPYRSYDKDKIKDLTKVLCSLTGTDFNIIEDLEDFFRNKSIKTGVWYIWGFFEFKCFKKGTAHFKFIDENVWETVNKKYAKIKGQVLPEKI